MDNAEPYYSYDNNYAKKSINNGIVSGVYYLHVISPGKMLQAGFQWTKENRPTNTINLFNYKYLDSMPIDSIYDLSVEEESKRQELGYLLLYVNQINTKWQCNAGVNGHATINLTNNDNAFLDNTLNLPLSKNTKGNTQNFDPFVKIGFGASKWKVSGGLTFSIFHENADYQRFKTSATDTLFSLDKTFGKLLPSLTVAYDLDSKQELKLTYSKTSDFPEYGDMCNFIDKSDPTLWVVGNPDLKPVNYENLYLNYTFSKETYNFSADVFYNITNNYTNWTTYPVSNTLSVSMPLNIAKQHSLGVDLSSFYQPVSKVDFTLSFSLSHTTLDANSINEQILSLIGSDTDLDIKRLNFKYGVKFNTNYRFNPTLSAMLDFNYVSREVMLEGYNMEYINSTMSFTKKLLKDDKLLVTVGTHNLFDNCLQHGSEINYAYINEKKILKSSDYKTNFFVTLQYKFNQGDRGTKDYGKR